MPAFAYLLREEGIEDPPERLTTVISLMREKVVEVAQPDGTVRKRNISFVSDLWPLCRFFFTAPTEYDEKTAKKHWKPGTADVMRSLMDVLATVPDGFSVGQQEEIVHAWVEQQGLKMGEVMNPWRLCLVGEGKGPGMYDISAFIGREETLKRMAAAIETLG